MRKKWTAEVLHFSNEVNVQNVASFLLDSNLERMDSTLVISITDQWKLRDLPLSINRARENWEFSFITSSRGRSR